MLASLIPLLGWWTYGLFDLDEGFYAAVTSEMNRRHEWITPFYNGHPWFEKPILLYWLAKPSLMLFGPMFGARLPDVLATLACSALCLWFCRRHFSERVAIFSTLIFASSPLVVALGRMMMTDPILMFCVSGAFLTFWESLAGNPRWRILSAVLLGLGVLAKGPVVGIFFIPCVLWIYFRHPDQRPAFKGSWFWGIVCFLLVVASWYLTAYLVDGQLFVQKFLVEQNLGRFSGGDEAHTPGGIQGIIYYVPIVLLGFLPWSCFLVPAWRKSEPDALNGFLKAWFLTVFIFFTITKAKLPHYMLPLAMPMAILIGQYFAKKNGGSNKVFAWPAASLLAVTFLANWAAFYYYHGITIGRLVVPGFQAEAHRIAFYVHDHAAPGDQVVEYKIGRQNKDRGTGHMKIQETKEPSILLYLDRNTLETDDWMQVISQAHPTWIITRSDRIPDSDLSHIKNIDPVPVPDTGEYFKLYLYDPADSSAKKN